MEVYLNILLHGENDGINPAARREISCNNIKIYLLYIFEAGMDPGVIVTLYEKG